MLKKYIVLLLLFVCVLSPTFSQDNVPGYLGKRAFIEYNYNAPLSYLFTLQRGNHLHSLHFQYILKRRLQVGLSFDLYNLEVEDGNTFDISQDFVGLNGNAIGVNFDWYRKGLLAPVGFYWRLEGKYLFGSFEEIDFSSTCCPLLDLSEVIEGDYSHYNISIGYGIRRIFKDIVVFNVGGSLGFSSSGGLNSNGHEAALSGAYNFRVHAGLGVLLF